MASRGGWAVFVWFIGVVLDVENAAADPLPRSESSLPVTLRMETGPDQEGWFVKGWGEDPETAGWLLVDTGANTALSDEVIQASLDHRAGARTLTQTSSGVMLPLWHFEGLTLHRLRVSVLSGEMLAQLHGRRRVIGLLGADFFERYTVKLDPARRELILFPSSFLPKHAQVTWVPLQWIQERPYVSAAWNGRRGTFLLDTGVEISTLKLAAAQRETLVAEWVRSPVPTEVNWFEQQLPVPVVTISTFELGGLKVEGPTMFLVDHPLWPQDGFIGYGILEHAATWWRIQAGQFGIEAGAARTIRLDDAPYEYERLRAFERTADAPAALALCQTLKARYPSRFYFIEEERDLLIASKQFPQAETALKDHLRKFGDDPEVWFALGELYGPLRRFEEARVAFRKAFALGYPDDGPRTLRWLWDIEYETQHFLAALAIARRALRLYPSTPWVLWAVGEGHARGFGDEKAFQEDLDRLPPWTRPEVLYQRACAYLRAGKLDEAVSRLEILYEHVQPLKTEEDRRRWDQWVNAKECLPLRHRPRFQELIKRSIAVP